MIGSTCVFMTVPKYDGFPRAMAPSNFNCWCVSHAPHWWLVNGQTSMGVDLREAPAECGELARYTRVRNFGPVGESPHEKVPAENVRIPCHAPRSDSELYLLHAEWAVSTTSLYIPLGKRQSLRPSKKSSWVVPCTLFLGLPFIPSHLIPLAIPSIQGVIMFGREREQAGIIVEPQIGHAFDVGDDDQLAVFRNKLWCVEPDVDVNERSLMDNFAGRSWKKQVGMRLLLVGSSRR